MFKKLAFLFVFVNTICIAQNDIYLPSEFQKAYNNNTRSFDGRPGKNYWINKSKYIINVYVTTETRTISGSAEIVYYNESPDDLSMLVFRLYQNWNKPNSSRDWNVDTNIFTTGVNIKKLFINNVNINLNNSNFFRITGTNAIVKLPEKLKSKNSINIYVEWEFQLPQIRNLRMGRYDKATYFIGYWYPQIAVYDDIHGWDLNEYTGTTEFYNDFSNFDVTISIEKSDAIIWATGRLINKEEVFSEKILNRLNKAYSSDTIIQIISAQDYLEKNIFKNSLQKRQWHFVAQSVPDFAFCFSDKYLWDATSIETENGKRVYINSTYKQDYRFFNEVIKISKDLLNYFTNEIPNVPYPYPSITVFNGAGGMEYPMMVNQSETDSFEDLVYVTSHEITHTYFPFYMGINERLYAWMDEGWAVILPMKFQKNYTGVDTRERNIKIYEQNAGTSIDLPLIVPSNQLRYDAYRFHAYNKSAFFYDVVMNLLGEYEFKEALKEYIHRWNGKHPTPYDFIFTINNVTGNDLNWFWRKWLFDFSYPDLAIESFNLKNDTLELVAINKGNLPIPLNIIIFFSDNTIKEYSYSPEIWKNNLIFRTSIFIDKKKVQKISIGNIYIPDCNINDNVVILSSEN